MKTMLALILLCAPAFAQVNQPLAAQYKTAICQGQLGDGLNAIAAGTYVVKSCSNGFGVTYTITSIQAQSDNAGTSTVNAANDASTGLLTGAVTAGTSWVSGTQSATTTIAANDSVTFTIVADGTSKRINYKLVATR